MGAPPISPALQGKLDGPPPLPPDVGATPTMQGLAGSAGMGGQQRAVIERAMAIGKILNSIGDISPDIVGELDGLRQQLKSIIMKGLQGSTGGAPRPEPSGLVAGGIPPGG